MSKPPKLVIPGLNRGIGVPPGFVLGRLPGTGQGPAQLLDLIALRKVGVASVAGVTQSTSTAISTAHSETVSLSTSVSTALSSDLSRINSLSTAIGGGGGGALTSGFDGGSASLPGRGFVLNGGTSAAVTELDYWIDGGSA